MQAWITNGFIMFGLGLLVGWILIKRPEWVGEAYQWIKHKITRS